MLPLVAHPRYFIQAFAMAVIVLCFVASSASIAAAQYGATTTTLGVIHSSGCYLWVQGSGFNPGTTVTITLANGSANTRTASVTASGTFDYLFAFNSNDNDGDQIITATGVNPGGGTHTATLRFKILKKCVDADWWNQGNSSKPPPPLPTDSDPLPPFGPTLAAPSAIDSGTEIDLRPAAAPLSESPDSSIAEPLAVDDSAVAVILAGGFSPNVELTPTNIERVISSLPAVSSVPDPMSLSSVLPLAGLLLLISGAAWRLGQEVDLV